MATNQARQWFLLSLMLPAVLLLAGCNLFSPLHSDGNSSDSHVLVADGKAALARGDYAKAQEYFRLGIEHNSRDSEARVGYAEAYMKVIGFSLAEFADTAMDSIKSDSSTTTLQLVVPSQWGVSTKAEVVAILNTLIAVLDEIPRGRCDGAYRANDINVNLTVGLFYTLRVAAQIEGLLSAAYQLQQLQKSNTLDMNNLNLAVSILNQLPQEFYWFVDGSGHQPALSLINALSQDAITAVDRLQTAASQSKSQPIKDMLDIFKDWEILFNQ